MCCSWICIVFVLYCIVFSVTACCRILYFLNLFHRAYERIFFLFYSIIIYFLLSYLILKTSKRLNIIFLNDGVRKIYKHRSRHFFNLPTNVRVLSNLKISNGCTKFWLGSNASFATIYYTIEFEFIIVYYIIEFRFFNSVLLLREKNRKINCNFICRYFFLH